VYQDGRPTSTVRENEGAGQLKAVSGADSRDNGLRRHIAPYGIILVVVLTATPRALSRHLVHMILSEQPLTRPSLLAVTSARCPAERRGDVGGPHARRPPLLSAPGRPGA
jgi:hypothetical protein